MSTTLGLLAALAALSETTPFETTPSELPTSEPVTYRLESVAFESEGQRLVGTLFLPNDASPRQPVSGVVIAGAWTTIKEHMPSLYAAELASRGLAALAFDFRTWGESEGATRSLEDPEMKITDFLAATEFLAARDEVDTVHGLGICAGSGYVATAAERSERLASIALVAPWLHDAAIVEEVYGGAAAVAGLIETGLEAQAAEARDGEPRLIPAAGPPGSDALMPLDSYYTDPERGLIEAWENTFNLASWPAWLRFDSQRAAAGIHQPTLIVHSDAAAIPQGARQFYAQLTVPRSQLWLDGVGQFDFYDQPEPVALAVDAVVRHFTSAAVGAAPTADGAEQAAIATTIDLLASLVDRGDYEALSRILADRVELDYTSLWGGEPATSSRDEVLGAWSGLLPGFDVTRHVFSNLYVQQEGAKATVDGHGVASHWLDGEVWTVSGRYQWGLEQVGGAWRISAITFEARDERGSRNLVGRAGERAAQSSPDWLLARRHRERAAAFLDHLEAKDMGSFFALWADNGVQDMPFSPEGFPKRVEGLEAIRAHWSGVPDNVGRMEFYDLETWADRDDPQRVFLRFRGELEILATGNLYANDYFALLEFDAEGKISLFQEHYDPIRLQRAWGTALAEGFDLD